MGSKSPLVLVVKPPKVAGFDSNSNRDDDPWALAMFGFEAFFLVGYAKFYGVLCKYCVEFVSFELF